GKAVRKPSGKNPYTQKRAGKNIISFVEEKAARSYRLLWDEHNHIITALYITIPDETAAEGVRRLNISFLLEFNSLAGPFAEALVTSFKTTESPYITAEGTQRHLKNGFCKFVKSINAQNMRLAEITTELVNDFIRWLGRTVDGVAVYQRMTKQHFAMAFNACIRQLQASESWSSHLAADLDIPTNIWAREPDNRVVTPTIPVEDYQLIYQACCKEISATMDKVSHLRELMTAQMDNPIARSSDAFPSHAYYPSGHPNQAEWAKNPYKDLGLCLATLRHRIPGVVLSITELEKMLDKMLFLVVAQKRPFGSVPGLAPCFYPSSRDLVPFIIMMGVHLDYNLETLLTSKVTDFRIQPST
ncbi:unnamed protein product, partial [marine sediment metagenome]